MIIQDSTIVVLTGEQLREFAAEIIEATVGAAPAGKADKAAPERRFVYGIHGIAGLFNVSLPTAQKYKNTFLAPAVKKRGRKIMTDVEEAVRLYDEARALRAV